MTGLLRSFRHTSTLLSLDTPWPKGNGVNRWFVTTVVIGFMWLMIPRAVGWRGDFLHSEDGQVFLTEFLASGWSSVTEIYAGYLHLAPRLLTGTCASVIGADAYAACVMTSANALRVALMLIAFPVLAAYARSWPWGLAAAAVAFIFLPAGQQEALANLANLRWFLIAGAVFALIGIFRQWWLLLVATLIVFVAALSDPMPLLLAPLAIWRLWSAPQWTKLPAIFLLVGGVLHLTALDASARGERGGFAELLADPQQTIGQLLVRGPLTSQWGVTISQDLAATVGFPLALLTLVVTVGILWFGWVNRYPNDPAVRLGILLIMFGFGLLLVTLSFPASYINLADFWSPSQPARYSTLTGLFITPVLVLAMSRAWQTRKKPLLPRLWVGLVGAVLLAAFIGDSGGDARSTNGPTWSESLLVARAQCAQGELAPVVPNAAAFEGWQTTLTCEWLGVG